METLFFILCTAVSLSISNVPVAKGPPWNAVLTACTFYV